jgi:hypothetical protein
MARRSLLPAILLFYCPVSLAFSCLVPRVEERFDMFDYVLLVEVTSAHLVGQPMDAPNLRNEIIDVEVTGHKKTTSPRKVEAVINVLKTYKSKSQPLKRIHSSEYFGGDDEISVGGIYLIFTRDGSLNFQCGGATKINVANDEHITLIQDVQRLSDAA